MEIARRAIRAIGTIAVWESNGGADVSGDVNQSFKYVCGLSFLPSFCVLGHDQVCLKGILAPFYLTSISENMDKSSKNTLELDHGNHP